MRRLARILILAVLVTGCTAQRARMDLNGICDVARKSMEKTDRDERTQVMVTELGKVHYMSRIEDAVKAVALANPATRYDLLKQAGGELGVTDWECPELKQLWEAQ